MCVGWWVVVLALHSELFDDDDYMHNVIVDNFKWNLLNIRWYSSAGSVQWWRKETKWDNAQQLHASTNFIFIITVCWHETIEEVILKFKLEKCNSLPQHSKKICSMIITPSSLLHYIHFIWSHTAGDLVLWACHSTSSRVILWHAWAMFQQ